MAIPSNSIMLLSFRGISFGQRILHTRTFTLLVPPAGEPTAQEVQEAFLLAVDVGSPEDLITPYVACLSSSYSLLEVRAQIVAPTRYAASSISADFPLEGGRGPTSTALLDGVITATTTLAGRDQVSNSKIGPVAAGDLANGLLSAPLKVIFDNYANTFTENVVTTQAGNSEWDSGIWHSKLPGPTVFFDAFTQARTQETARAKTTRTVGRGE